MNFLFKFFNLYIYKRKKGFGVSYFDMDSETISFAYNFNDKKELKVFLLNYLENTIINNTFLLQKILIKNNNKDNKNFQDDLNFIINTQSNLSLKELLPFFISDIYSYILFFFEIPEIIHITGLTKFSLLPLIRDKSYEQVCLKYIPKNKINILKTVYNLLSLKAA